MLPHVQKKLEERGLKYSEIFLRAVAKDCQVDTAVVLDILAKPVPYKNDTESNGNMVIMIVRNQFPVTIMFRRSNQPLTPKSLDVREILFWRSD